MYLFLRGVEGEIADIKGCRCLEHGKILEFLVCLLGVSKSFVPKVLLLILISIPHTDWAFRVAQAQGRPATSSSPC
jgi:hypothetical protein